MRHLLRQIRPESQAHTTVQQKVAWVVGVILLGASLGLFAKLFGTTPVIGLIGTYLGFWIFAATVIAAWSRSPIAAALDNAAQKTRVLLLSGLAFYLFTTLDVLSRLFGAI